MHVYVSAFCFLSTNSHTKKTSVFSFWKFVHSPKALLTTCSSCHNSNSWWKPPHCCRCCSSELIQSNREMAALWYSRSVTINLDGVDTVLGQALHAQEGTVFAKLHALAGEVVSLEQLNPVVLSVLRMKNDISTFWVIAALGTSNSICEGPWPPDTSTEQRVDIEDVLPKSPSLLILSGFLSFDGTSRWCESTQCRQ